MKKLIIILFIVVAVIGYGCSDKIKTAAAEEEINSKLSVVDRQIINDLKTYVSSIMTRWSRSENSDALVTSINNSDEYNLELYPIYKFDEEVFYKNPSPETLILAVKKSSDRKVYMGKRKKGDKSDMIRIEAQKYNGDWIPCKAVYEWGKVVSRFEGRSSQKFDLNKMKVFEFAFKEYGNYIQ